MSNLSVSPITVVPNLKQRRREARRFLAYRILQRVHGRLRSQRGPDSPAPHSELWTPFEWHHRPHTSPRAIVNEGVVSICWPQGIPRCSRMTNCDMLTPFPALEDRVHSD